MGRTSSFHLEHPDRIRSATIKMVTELRQDRLPPGRPQQHGKRNKNQHRPSQSSGAKLEDAYDPDLTFGNGTDDEQEQDHDDLLFGPPQIPPRIPPPGQRNSYIQMPTAAQMANCDGNQMMAISRKDMTTHGRTSTTRPGTSGPTVGTGRLGSRA